MKSPERKTRIVDTPYRAPNEMEDMRKRVDLIEQRLDSHARLIDEHATDTRAVKLRASPMTALQRSELNQLRLGALALALLGLLVLPASTVFGAPALASGLGVAFVASAMIWRDEDRKRG